MSSLSRGYSLCSISGTAGEMLTCGSQSVQEVQVHKFVVDRMLWTGDKPTPVLESRLRNPLPSDN